MRHPFRHLLIASGVLLAAATFAAPAGADPWPPAQITLTVTPGDGSAPPLRTVTLDCPPGGTHPNPLAACTELAAAGGDFDALTTQAPHRVCTMIWDPITVTATGHWGTRAVDYRHTFANSCVLEGAAAVFRF
ncbi:subtilase-type protease inhibitor [Nocardia sp. BMG51109]|uniref:subtilase-type protease inhibitor n=1 Tax=Nocardia sp. BMG51109 TaxID=1056816 RepID=UPI000462F0CA|nr:subtilase-type protease inhibitor [Nocardia sp. BMG51109]